MHNQAFNGKDPISVKNYVTELKRTCEVFLVNVDPAVLVVRDLMVFPMHSTIN